MAVAGVKEAARAAAVASLLVLIGVLVGACGSPRPGGTHLDLLALARSGLAGETSRIDFGLGEARRHLLHGWAERSDEAAGKSFLWAVGGSSSLAFRVFALRDLELGLRCRPIGLGDGSRQAMTVSVNDRELGRLELKPGVASYRLEIPREALVVGDNLLAFRYRAQRPVEEMPELRDRRPLSVAWYALSLDEARRTGPHIDGATVDGASPGGTAVAAGLSGAEGGDLVLPAGSLLSYTLRLPPAGRLVLSDLELAGEGGAAPSVVIRAEGGGGPVETTVAAPRRRVEVPLSGDRPEFVRLSLEVAETGGGAASAVRVGSLGVMAPSSTPGGGAEPAPAAREAAPEPPGRPPNVILYVVDTLRADRVGCCGEGRRLTPHMDAFAAEALVVERALAQAPWTRPAMASILTGLHPRSHATNSYKTPLPQSAVTLAEMLHEAGFETAGFVANPQVGAPFAFDQGFERYEELGLEDVDSRISSSRHNDRISAWLAARRDWRPLFLYVHTIDPHAPYTPTGAFRRRFAPEVSDAVPGPAEREALAELRARLEHTYVEQGDMILGSIPWLMALEEGNVGASDEAVRDLERLYDAEVAYNDEQFGRFLETLRGAGLYDDSIVVLVSDHGEEFGEHGHWQHGRTLYSEALRVPLMIKPPAGGAIRPGHLPAGRQVDVVPTVLDLLGLPAHPGLEGLSLVSPGYGEPDRPPVAYAYLREEGLLGSSVTLGRWKMIELLGSRRDLELYDLEADPEERINLAAERPLLTAYLRFLALTRDLEASRLEPGAEIKADADTRRRLEALGYL